LIVSLVCPFLSSLVYIFLYTNIYNREKWEKYKEGSVAIHGWKNENLEGKVWVQWVQWVHVFI
jgi:hypothetical protein